MRSGTGWWWIGLLLALVARIGWLATLHMPEPWEEPGHSLFRENVPASIDSRMSNSQARSANSASVEERNMFSLPLGSRYVIYPVVREICMNSANLGLPWYWVLGGLQALLQSAAVGGLALVAWQVFGSRFLATLTVLGAATYPPSLLQLVSLSDLPLIACLAINWLALVLVSARTGGVIAPALVGLLGGLLMLLRPGWGLAIALVTVWYLWQLRQVCYGWLASIFVVLALANVCGTWFGRHWLQTGEAIPFAGSFWQFLADGLPPTRPQFEDKPSYDWRGSAHRVLRVWQQYPRSCLQYRLMLWGDVLTWEPAYDFGWPAATGSEPTQVVSSSDQGVAEPYSYSTAKTTTAKVSFDQDSAQTSGQSVELARIPRPSTAAIGEIPVPKWMRFAFSAGLLPAMRCLFWLGVIFGWRWSFRLSGPHWPISATLGSVLLAYGFGSYQSLKWAVAAVEPILLLYVLFALTSLLPGAWSKTIAHGFSAIRSADTTPASLSAQHG